MYTTRAATTTPDDPSGQIQGPNSGCLVLEQGFCYNKRIKDLPFPQNQLLSFEYVVSEAQNGYRKVDKVYLIPVINCPLSANRYYAIAAHGTYQGLAYASSKEEDKVTCLFCFKSIQDVRPRPLDPKDLCQQFDFYETETCCGGTKLKAKSIAPGNYLPSFLGRRELKVYATSQKMFTLGEARGLDSALRAHLPDFNFPLSQQQSDPVVVGKWYSPFMFIKEGTIKEQFEKSMFYEITLEQRWEKIFSKANECNERKVVKVDGVVKRERVRIGGKGVIRGHDGKGVVWFKTKDGEEGYKVGLNVVMVERMMWEQERGGWVKGEERRAKIVKDEEYDHGWKSFGCYMLVESFVIRRNDASEVLIYEFMHNHQLRSKWE